MDQPLVCNDLRISFRDREAHVNQYNAARQHAVNAAAAHYGAGTGTAAHYGVPGELLIIKLQIYKSKMKSCLSY